ncbi:MAG: cell division protein FtsA [Bdellovibrionales bacterium]|nr:cell division protein FtsA [Bdellovibrionales bacterium]
MRDEEFVVGLDFGTTKICTVVGQVVEDTNAENGVALKILAVGKAPSTGIKKGVVVNIEETVEGIRKSVRDAELMAGIEAKKAIVGVAGSHIKGFNSTGVVGVKGREIERADVERVIDAARSVAIPADRMALHVLPQEYTLDGEDGIRDPLGMMGTRLEAKVHIVTAAQSAIQNIIRCCNKTGLNVESLVLQPLASAKAVLSKDEMELGVVLVDIGGGTTDIAIFHGGSIIHTSILPIGGQHITQDLAIGLRTPQSEAERLKVTNGCSLKSLINADETIEVPSIGGRPARVVERRLLGDIIEPRLEEIFQLVNREIIASGAADMLGGGVVLTGGSTLMTGAVELAEFVFDLPVKRAAPEGLAGFADMVASPAYSTVVGLVQWGLQDRRPVGSKKIKNNTGSSTVAVERVKNQLKHWLGEMF